MAKTISPLECFFSPKSVAVIGASRTQGKIGNVVLSNFVRGFRGKIFAVNSSGGETFGLPLYTSIKSVKEPIDLAIVCVPATAVPKVVQECGQKKVNCVTIISAGFQEVGNEKVSRELEKVLKQYPKMKVMGPNCLGVLDSKSGVDMLFLPQERLGRPRKGVTSFISQSGALGSAILDWDAWKGYGINKFVSYGNATALDESDLLDYLSNDSSSKVVVAYLEGVKNGNKFFKACQKVSSNKPLICIKGGQSEEGSKAAHSHTAALAGNAKVYSGVFAQTNVVEAHSMEEVFDFARIFANEPAPKGNKVQIITDGGGYGVLAADAAAETGLKLAEMKPESIAEVKKVSPPYAVLRNPMDLTGDADNARYKAAIDAALKDENVDMLLLIVLFQIPALDEKIVQELSQELKKRSKPVVVMSAGGKFSETQRQLLEENGITTFTSPLDAAKALKALSSYYLKKKRAAV
ncbi:MAG: CoA-binding protein [Candidatus Diapherotrites archaeon]